MNRLRALSTTAVALSVLLALCMAAASAAPRGARDGAGSRDRSFGGGDGVAYSALKPAYDYGIFTALVEAPDGSLVDALAQTTVFSSSGSSDETVIQRRRSDGSLDPSFGSGGSVAVSVPLSYPPESLAVDSAGRVLYLSTGETGTTTIHRLNPDGSVDGGFHPPKQIHKGFEPGKILPLPDGDVVVAGRYQLPAPKDLTGESGVVVGRLDADGTPDPGFGKGGFVSVKSPSYGFTTFEDAVALADGSVVLLAEGSLLRYGTDGAPGRAFGEDGAVKLPDDFEPASLLATSDGGLLVAGATPAGSGGRDSDHRVLAYGSDGSPIDSFGEGGAATIDAGHGAGTVDLLAAPDGGSVLVGVTEVADPGAPDPTPQPVAIRLDASGHPLPGFGKVGVLAVTSTAPPAGIEDGYERVTSAVVGPSGRILIAGSDEDPVIRARAADGALDPSFGGGASQVTQVKTNKGVALAKGLVADPSGKLFVSANTNAARRTPDGALIGFSAGGRQTSLDPKLGFAPLEISGPIFADREGGLISQGHFHLARVDRSGAPDPGFGKGGIVHFPKHVYGAGLLVGKGGALIVVGHLKGHGMVAVRYSPAGRLDRSFGKGGSAVVSFGQGSGTARAAVVLPDGSLLLAGSARKRLALARLGPDGRLDRSFGDRGRLVFGLQVRTSAMQLARLGNDLVVSGSRRSEDGGRSTFAMRLDADGRPRRGFGRGGSLDTSGIERPLAILPSRHRIVLVGSLEDGGVMLRAFDRKHGGLDRSFGAGGTVRAAERQGRFRFQPVAAVRDAKGAIVVAGTSGNGYRPGSRVELLRFRD